MNPELPEKAKALPTQPGVYVFKDETGRPICNMTAAVENNEHKAALVGAARCQLAKNTAKKPARTSFLIGSAVIAQIYQPMSMPQP